MWKHIVIEGYCLGKEPSSVPCGRKSVSTFCLLNGHCPYFAYAESKAREAAVFVPLRLVIWDKVKSLGEDTSWKLKWYLWDRFFFEKKDAKFMEYLKSHTSKCHKWEKIQKEAEDKFPEWFKEVKDVKEE